jgi:hypothetical protein
MNANRDSGQRLPNSYESNKTVPVVFDQNNFTFNHFMLISLLQILFMLALISDLWLRFPIHFQLLFVSLLDPDPHYEHRSGSRRQPLLERNASFYHILIPVGRSQANV